MKGLTIFEEAVFDKLLAGVHPTLVALRAQANGAQLKSRKNTGAGFFCYFNVSPDAKPLGNVSFHFGDVDAVLPGETHGAGFALFVKDGKLDRLEGYSYDEAWPGAIEQFELKYQHEPRQLQLPGAAAR